MWVELGGDLDAFWRQTPKTFSIFVRGRERAREEESRRANYQAWLTARLTGFAKVPDFDDIFRPTGQRDDPARMEATAKTIAATGWGEYTPPPSSSENGAV